VIPRILVAEDHDLIRRGIASVIQSDGACEVCGEAADGMDAVNKVRELKPDIVTLDVSMPLMGGLEAARQIREIAPAIRIIIVTMHDSPQIRAAAKSSGANAVVTKNELTTGLIDVIKEVLKE
jgi:DNA-binding NarL/FixJ family response regulator